jgi:DNA transformation protein and related proteins
MSVSREFVAHALDLVSLAGPVQARAMFGGYGLYLRGAMFGLLDDDEVFLKTDESCRGDFVEAGCRQWVYQSRQGPMPTQYYRPPDDAHEDPEAMLPWARLAIGAAQRAARAKAEKARKGAARRKPAGKRPAPKGPSRVAKKVSTGSARGRSGPASRSRRRR